MKQEVIVYERYTPFSSSANNHMQVHICSIDQKKAGDSRDSLEETVKAHLPGAKLRRVQTHAEVIDHLGDDSTTPYVYFEIPGDNSARGRQVERYVYAQEKDGPRVPMSIGRAVGCAILNCEDKVDWRQCAEDKDSETKLARTFREMFKPYQPK